ncbi:MAG: PHP domain-containing protein [Chloroflexi bacterium]|nr:PHP domain-containing protein [Chloroflexota bacterium]
MAKIDLHMHSTASDGVYSPSELVRIALERGLSVIALTDHDSLEGVPEALAAAEDTGLTVIAGLELGCENGPRDVHVLGYGLDPYDEELRNKLAEMRDYREHRAERIVEKLNSLGIPVTYERICEIAGEGVIARPHIAKAMIEVGAVADYQEAFDKYIHNDGPAYVPRLRLSPEDGINLIHQAGGVAIVAHPCRYADPIGVVREFAGHGVDGVEIFYPDNPPQLRNELNEVADELGLIKTGGCDFHRPGPNGDLLMGCEDVPQNAVDSILARAERYRV